MTKVERTTWESMRILSPYETLGGWRKIPEQYEKLVNLVGAYGGKVHGSQYVRDGIDHAVAVYFFVPRDVKEEFKKEENNDYR